MDADNRHHLVALIRAQRWGALATVGGDGAPLASSVAFVLAPGARGFLLHLSRLAEHTRNLLERPAASLVIGEPDGGDGDPQTLARFSVQGQAKVLEPGSSGYAALRAAYIARLPAAGERFGFSDFELFVLAPSRGHFVGGFARAFPLDADDVIAVLGECLQA